MQNEIEQMARLICISYNSKACNSCYDNDFCSVKDEAQRLYTAGYRKASEVAEEIFAEIEKIIDIHYNRHIFGDEDLSDTEQEAVMNFSGDVTYDIAELKKKYAESEKDK